MSKTKLKSNLKGISLGGNQGGYTRTTTERTERTVTNGAGNGYGGMDYPPGGQTTFNSNTARTVTSGSLNSGGGSGRIPYCEACKQQIRYEM